jgi:outer membrane lipoprotein-sorting protein
MFSKRIPVKIIISLSLAFALPLQAEMKVEEVLQAVGKNTDKITSMKAKVVIKTNLPEGEEQINLPTSQEFNYWFKKPDKVKMEMLKPMKQVIVYDGEMMLMRNPLTGEVIKQKTPAGVGIGGNMLDVKSIREMIKKQGLKLKKSLPKKGAYVLEGKWEEEGKKTKTEMTVNFKKGVIERIKVMGENGEEISVMDLEYKKFPGNIWVPVRMVSKINAGGKEITTTTCWQNISVNLEIPDEEFQLKGKED